MPDPFISHRVQSLKTSATIAVANRAKALRRQGVDVLSFAAGEPDYETPERIRAAACEALAAGQTKYMPTLGDPETRAVIAEKLRGENGIEGLTHEHVGVSAGAKQSLFCLAQALFDTPTPGTDPAEAILPVPIWVSYRPLIELAGGRVVEVETTLGSGFKMTPDQLRAAITPRTRLLVLNSPSNPCGTMYRPAEIESLAAAVADAASTIAPDLVIISDEIYEKIVYGSDAHRSIGSIAAVADRTITVNGLSKAFAMTGWRAGYAACPGDWGKQIIKAMGTYQGQISTNITSFVYPAIRVALTECAADVDRMCAGFAERAAIMHDGLSAIEGLKTTRPVAAFYAFPDVSALFGTTTPDGRKIDSALAFAEALLEEARIAVVPGEDFGGCSRNHIRLSFACSNNQIVDGVERLARFVDRLTR
jgi:aspartate aminotransferase